MALSHHVREFHQPRLVKREEEACLIDCTIQRGEAVVRELPFPRELI